MLIQYYQCDYCKTPIENDKRKKFKTKEMGYPFIDKNGGGRHYHYDCLANFYRKRKHLPEKEVLALLEDAERRHSRHIKGAIKKGTLTKEKLEMRKATKKDRDSLINYFYDYYGARTISKGLQSVIDNLNKGEDFGSFKNVHIPYYQMKDMLVYYQKTLNSYYKKRKEKGQMVDVTDRIFFDIIFCANNIEEYANNNKAAYNQAQNITKVNGGETIQNNSKILVSNTNIKKKEAEKLVQEAEQVKQLLKELDDDDWGE